MAASPAPSPARRASSRQVAPPGQVFQSRAPATVPAPGKNFSLCIIRGQHRGLSVTWFCQVRSFRPSPQPSPHGRGSSPAAVEGASPLPWGEGQGEGRSAQFIAPSCFSPAPWPPPKQLPCPGCPGPLLMKSHRHQPQAGARRRCHRSPPSPPVHALLTTCGRHPGFPQFPSRFAQLILFPAPLCHKMWSRFGRLTTKHRCGLLHPRDTSKPPNRIISKLAASGEHPSRRVRRHLFLRWPSRRLPSVQTLYIAGSKRGYLRCRVPVQTGLRAMLCLYVLRRSVLRSSNDQEL